MPLKLVGYMRAERLEGELCTRCWRSALLHLTLVLLLPSGVSEHDRGIRCLHCDLGR